MGVILWETILRQDIIYIDRYIQDTLSWAVLVKVKFWLNGSIISYMKGHEVTKIVKNHHLGTMNIHINAIQSRQLRWLALDKSVDEKWTAQSILLSVGLAVSVAKSQILLLWTYSLEWPFSLKAREIITKFVENTKLWEWCVPTFTSPTSSYLKWACVCTVPVLAAPASVSPPSGQDLYYGRSSLGSPSGL